MLAFLNDAKIQANLIVQVQAHYDADEIVKGRYWENGKGCLVGCWVHGSSHADFEARFGIPLAIAHLLDGIFERLPNREAKEFPLAVARAIPLGADLRLVVPQFLLALLTDEEHGTRRWADTKGQEATTKVATLIRRRLAARKPEVNEWAVAEAAVEVEARWAATRWAAAAAAVEAATRWAATRWVATAVVAAVEAARWAAEAAEVAEEAGRWQAATILRLLSEAPVLPLSEEVSNERQ